MTNREHLVNELKGLPDFVIDEVYSFVEYLKHKWLEEKQDILTAATTSLQKDWLRPEEDKAWENL